jgi:hypothetical protein
MADEASDLRGLPAGTIHCRLEDVVSYRASDLPPERASLFVEHLRSCAACRRLVRDATSVLTEIDAAIRAVESKASDVDLMLARLQRKAVERAARPERQRPRQPSPRFWLPMAGVAAIVVLIAVLQLVAVLLPRRWRSAHGAVEARSSQPVAGSVGTSVP